MPTPSVSALRQSLKSARNAIPTDSRLHAEERATEFLTRWDLLQRCKKIACYHAIQGEFPTTSLIEILLSMSKEIYLPIIREDEKIPLAFQQIIPQQSMQQNRYGISEPHPDPNLQINVKDLDLVILPLLGFDRNGNRLGMGGGYYDRTFAFTKESKVRRPYLMGLAFTDQLSDQLIAQPWDVSLDATLTEDGLIQPL